MHGDYWTLLRDSSADRYVFSTAPAPCAVFFLSTGLCKSSLQARNATIFEQRLRHACWEVCRGESLEELPASVARKVTDYRLIIVYVASREVLEAHRQHLQSLSPQFPFLLLIDEPSEPSLRSHCATLSSASPVRGMLPLTVLIAACRSPEGITAEKISSTAQSDASLLNADGRGAREPWPGDFGGRVKFSAVVSGHMGACDGRLIGGLLKRVAPSSMIRLLVEKFATVVVHAEAGSADAAVSMDEALSQVCQRSGITPSHKLQVSAHSLVIGLSPSAVEGACLLLRNELAGAFPSVTVGPAFRFEVTAHVRVFLLMEALVRTKEMDAELAIRVEDVSLPEPVSEVEVDVEVQLPEEAHKKVPQPQLPTQQQQQPQPKPLIAFTPGQVSTPPTLLDARTTEDTTVSYGAQIALTRSECEQAERRMLRALEEHSRTHAEAVEALQKRLEAAAAKESQDLLRLASQFTSFREQAADHALVEAALQELRLASVPKQTFVTVEKTLLEFSSTVADLKATVKTQTSRIDSMEAMQAGLQRQLETLARDAKAHREDDGTAQSLQSLASRQRDFESHCNTFHKAFETAADRLHSRTVELAKGQEALLTWRDHHNERMLSLQRDTGSLGEQLADLQHSLASMGSQHLAQRVSEQCEAVKAHCTMLCTRSGEVQNEIMTNFEKRVSAEYRKIVGEVQLRLDGIDSSVTGTRGATQEELDLARMHSGQALRLSEDLRQRVGELERGQAEVASLLEFEESRVQQLSEIRRRIDVLEGRLRLFEGRPK